MKVSSLKRLDILTLFPAMFEGPLSASLLGRARDRRLLDLRVHNLRDYSVDAKHHKVDDRPYGGGAGMVIQAEPVYQALRAIKRGKGKPYVVYLSPQGERLSQAVAESLAGHTWLLLVCGHYEGIDERVMRYIDAEVSIGDFVLTGGEIPAMVVADCVARLVPGVVKETDSILQDSFQEGRLDYPHYTRPAVWRGQPVPQELLSGDHAQIRQWRQEASERVTQTKRPDLWERLHSRGRGSKTKGKKSHRHSIEERS